MDGISVRSFMARLLQRLVWMGLGCYCLHGLLYWAFRSAFYD